MDEIEREAGEDESGAGPLPLPVEAGASPEVAVPPPVTRRLDRRYISLQRSVGWMATAVLSLSPLAGAIFGWLAGRLSPPAGVLVLPAWLLVTGVIAWALQVWPAVQYRHTSYTLGPEGIEIQSGVWWRHVINVPRSRVQHIDVSQGPMERSYGLGRLVIYTAGTAHSRVELPGLSDTVAYDLRNHLLPRGTDDAV
jgi:membrane protein YdbS with pleckstrin-like domain